MAKRPVRLSGKAERWFLLFIADLADKNPQAARNIVSRLEKVRETLADFPEMTERGPLPGTRRVVMRPLILTIRPKGNILEIVTIRHERQKPPSAKG